MSRVSPVLFACACAGGGDQPVDAKRYDDAPVDIVLSDAEQLVTLSQTTSPLLEAGISRACLASPSGTAPNNYYRVFDLTKHDITRDFHVRQVAFQVEHCHEFDASAGLNVTVRIGTYTGTISETLALSGMVILDSVDVHVPEIIESGDPPMTPGGTVVATFDRVVASNEKLLVEIDTPDGAAAHQFFMGANNDGEIGNGYVLAPSCGITTPTNVSSMMVANMPIHFLITVSGTY
jgi:hypothetical protein